MSSDLIHFSKDIAVHEGYTRKSTTSMGEFRTYQIGNRIVKLAALFLIEQIKASGTHGEKNHDGVVKDEEEKINSPVSPMSLEEFYKILANGIQFGSSCSPDREPKILGDFGPVSKEEDFVAPEITRRPFPEAAKLKSAQFAKQPIRTGTSDIKETPRRVISKPKAPPVGDITPMENRASRLRRQKLEESRKPPGGRLAVNK